MGGGPEPLLSKRKGAPRTGLRPCRVRLDRWQRLAAEHAQLHAQVEERRRNCCRGLQLHSGSAAQLSRGSAVRRILAGNPPQGLQGIWGGGVRECRRGGSAEERGARTPRLLETYFA